MLLTASLLATSCSLVGERFKIVTDKPADDFLVKCMETHSYLIGHNASGKRVTDGVFIAESGEEAFCGINLYGHNSRAQVSHPIYKYNSKFQSSPKIKYSDNGSIIKEFIHWKEKNTNVVKLFEDGFWDNNKYKYRYTEDRFRYTQEDAFIKHISYCSISSEYLDLYSQDKISVYQELKNKYYNDILQCNRENEQIRHKYNRSNDAFYYTKRGRFGERLEQCTSYNSHCKKSRIYLPEKTIASRNKYMWKRLQSSIISGTNTIENDPLVDETKKSFIVAFGLSYIIPAHRGGETLKFGQKAGEGVVHYFPEQPSNTYINHIWFYVDAYNRKDVTKVFDHDYTVFDLPPTWIAEYSKNSFIKDCEKNYLHFNIYALDNKERSTTYKNFYKIATGNKLNTCINSIK